VIIISQVTIPITVTETEVEEAATPVTMETSTSTSTPVTTETSTVTETPTETAPVETLTIALTATATSCCSDLLDTTTYTNYGAAITGGQKHEAFVLVLCVVSIGIFIGGLIVFPLIHALPLPAIARSLSTGARMVKRRSTSFTERHLFPRNYAIPIQEILREKMEDIFSKIVKRQF